MTEAEHIDKRTPSQLELCALHRNRTTQQPMAAGATLISVRGLESLLVQEASAVFRMMSPTRQV